MPEIPHPTWTLKSLLIRALPWTLLAAWIWKLTAVQNAAFTVMIAKWMHALAGRPAPYLFCDERMLFWHATMFPPIVGLGREQLATLEAGPVGDPDTAATLAVEHPGETDALRRCDQAAGKGRAQHLFESEAGLTVLLSTCVRNKGEGNAPDKGEAAD